MTRASTNPPPDPGGDPGGNFVRLYDELRGIARRYLSLERKGHTLQATALVNEAWLRLLDRGESTPTDLPEFQRAAAQTMRRILIDHARGKLTDKRGGRRARLSLDAMELAGAGDFGEILAIDEAIEQLAMKSPTLAEIARLRFYSGLEMEDVATVLGMSRRSVFREWAYAKALLAQALGGDG